MTNTERILVYMYEMGTDPTRPDPTLEELGELVGVNRQTAYYHLTKLRDAGLVTWGNGRRRALTPLGVTKVGELL